MIATLGVQEPTFHVGPVVADSSTADEGLELAAIASVGPLPWQIEQVHSILGLSESGDYAAPTYGLAVPRQNGKGVVLEIVVLAKTVLLGERVLWTAHEVRTMQESFTRFRALLDSVASLAETVKTVRTANGQESIQFHNGAEVKFNARSKSASRGLGFRTIICDEAQELDYLTLGAIQPTLSGQRDERTQLIVTGTPPYSRKGEVFTDFRAAAHTGGNDRLSWSEWSCERGDSPTSVAVWARTNPSMGVIVMESKIADEWATLQAKPDIFRRERLGEWGRSGSDALALDENGWAEGSAPWPARDSRYRRNTDPIRAIGVDCTFNAEMTTIVEAVPLEDDVIGLQVLHAAPGLEWVGAAVQHLREDAIVHVAFDPLRTGDLSRDLRASGIPSARMSPATSRDLTLACDGLVRLVREGKIHHKDPRLDAAAGGATRSTFNDGRGWKLVGLNGTDVSPLIAGALAAQLIGNQIRPVRLSDRRRVVVR